MTKYHPDARFLTDYVAGSLPEEQALCVATHLHYCAACRSKVQELTELGAELFLREAPLAAPAQRNDEAFGRLLARIGTQPPAAIPPSARPDLNFDFEGLAFARGDIENLSWRRIGGGFRYSRLPVGSGARETSLLHIRAGSSVPHHRHAGDEITVVLQGSFSDQDDQYGVGDFIVRTPGERHRPVASQDEDCLCLTTLDRPIVMTNPLFRLLQPLF